MQCSALFSVWVTALHCCRTSPQTSLQVMKQRTALRLLFMRARAIWQYDSAYSLYRVAELQFEASIRTVRLTVPTSRRSYGTAGVITALLCTLQPAEWLSEH